MFWPSALRLDKLTEKGFCAITRGILATIGVEANARPGERYDSVAIRTLDSATALNHARQDRVN